MKRRPTLPTALLALILALCLALPGCTASDTPEQPGEQSTSANAQQEDRPESDEEPASLAEPQSAEQGSEVSLESIPQWSGSPYIDIEDGVPSFSDEEIAQAKAGAFEEYGTLDSQGRCTVAFACVGKETMPTGERGDISTIKPTGWHSSRYDFVDGESLYNRCHLLGHQLTAEDANERNLVTGTRYMNTQGMLPFENDVADYVKKTGNHVLMRVTPVFAGEDLVAHGVRMEARSVEDDGAGVSFDVYCYNVQPQVSIDYATGDNAPAEGSAAEPLNAGVVKDYVLNLNSNKFHEPGCPSAAKIAAHNRQDVSTTREVLISQGYDPCGNCNP